VEGKQGSDITDQIPHIVRPMGVVEGTSYTVLIVAGLAFAGEPILLHLTISILAEGSNSTLQNSEGL